MKGKTAAILIGVLVVLVMLIVYYASKNPAFFRKGYWLANYVENPWTVYSRSAGTFDDAAQLALGRVTGRAAPTPGDHALAATIITRNIIGHEHRPEYTADGTPTPNTVTEAQRRREMMGTARTHFMAALTGLRDGGRAVAPRPTRIAAAAGGAQVPGVAFIVDRADEFAHAGMLAAIENDPLFWFLDLGFGMGPEWGFGIDTPLAVAAQETRKATIAERQAAAHQAAAVGGGVNLKRDTVTEYVRLATEDTNDPQNTHDVGVLACLHAVVVRLRSDQGSAELPTLDAIKADIGSKAARLSDARPYRVKEVNAVIDRVGEGERVTKLDATDKECLRRVWLRTSDPRNIHHKDDLEQAIFDALLDCWEDGVVERHIVCVNGRTSRILSALVMLDWDERNWVVKKLEQFKNDIFDRSRAVILDVARIESTSANPAMRSAGAAYLATTTAELTAAGDVPPEAATALAEKMRVAIDKMIDDYIAALKMQGIDSAIPEYMVNAVKTEARAAVTE